MKKILLTLSILFLPSLCFASASLKIIKVNPDTLVADSGTGTIYNGKVALLNGGKISLNRNYINNITTYNLDGVRYVRFMLGNFSGHNYCPNLPTNLYGKVGDVAYATWTSAQKAWVKSAGSGPVALFQDNGVVINADYFVKTESSGNRIIDTSMGSCKLYGKYPEWRVYVDIQMNLNDYQAFKSGMTTWAQSIHQEITPASGALTR